MNSRPAKERTDFIASFDTGNQYEDYQGLDAALNYKVNQGNDDGNAGTLRIHTTSCLFLKGR